MCCIDTWIKSGSRKELIWHFFFVEENHTFFVSLYLRVIHFKTVYWNVKMLLMGYLTEDSLKVKITGDDIFTPLR